MRSTQRSHADSTTRYALGKWMGVGGVSTFLSERDMVMYIMLYICSEVVSTIQLLQQCI